MRERWRVWTARMVLLVPVGILAWFLIPALTADTIKHSNEFWPYGHVHNVAEGISIVLSYMVGLVIFCALVPFIYILLKETIRCTWCTAWRIDHRAVHVLVPREEVEWVTFKRPAPLIRGRIGSR